jgi:hypothetical protein
MFMVKNYRSADAVCSLVHLDEGLSLEILLTSMAEKSLICFVGTRRPTASAVKQLSSGIKCFEI